MEKEITLKLPASIVQLVIAALGKQPFEAVAPAINMIVAQANPQMQPPPIEGNTGIHTQNQVGDNTIGGEKQKAKK